MLAVDIINARILGYDFFEVPYLALAAERSGLSDPSAIEVDDDLIAIKPGIPAPCCPICLPMWKS